MNEQHRDALLKSSAAYATARLAFANAIVIAQSAGADETEIAHVTGLSVPGIRAVLRTGADGPRFRSEGRAIEGRLVRFRSETHPRTRCFYQPSQTAQSAQRVATFRTCGLR